MAERMPPAFLSAARIVGSAAAKTGVEAYLVGGSVRDLLMGVPNPGDLDVTLVGADDSTFDRIASIAAGKVDKRSQFTTARLRLGELSVDLAMTRTEDYPHPGSLPVVRPGTLAEDMARRDFSVNAMAVSLAVGNFGDLKDATGGQADVETRTLRALHAGGFRDDATRILRAARYASRLTLTPDTGTLTAIRASVGYVSTISPARVRDELGRVFLEGEAAPRAMSLLDEWGALSAIYRSLTYASSAWYEFPNAARDRPAVAVGYAILGSGLRGPQVDGVVARLRPASLIERVLRESAALGECIAAGGIVDVSNSVLANLLDPLEEATVVGVSLASTGSDRTRLDDYLERLRRVRPLLTGDDLIDMGISEGPEVGRILTELRRAKLDGGVATVDQERAVVRGLMRRDGA